MPGVYRREFIRSAGLAAAGLSLTVPFGDLARNSATTPAAPLQPAAFLRIAPDGIITIWVIRLEMGQGVRTLYPMLIAEDLEADWSHIRIEQANPVGEFRKIELHTGGSESAPLNYLPLRTAGAAAREMLISAASTQWRVHPQTCRAELSNIIHEPSGRRLSYGSLAAAAAVLPVPASPKLKPKSEFRIIGRGMKRIDAHDIVTGKAKYGTDVRVAGMVFASITRAPSLGAKVASVDDSAALKVPGVLQVLRVSAGLNPGVAVVAKDSWSAMQGRKALIIEWTPGHHATFDSDEYLASHQSAFDGKQYKVRLVGDPDAAMRAATKRIEATYVYPFQAHAPVETLNCTAHVKPDSAEIWVSTQTDVRTLESAAKVSRLPDNRITVHCSLMGGAFGRRLFADYVSEAVELSVLTGKPVQVLWMRADDMRHGYYQPGTSQRFRGGVDAQGQITSVVHNTTYSDLTIYDWHDGRDIWNGDPRPDKQSNEFESAGPGLYVFPNTRVDLADVTSPVPTGPWRAVQAPASVFARESFIDELARLAGKDPIALRIELLPIEARPAGARGLDRGRLVRVLEEARRKSGWSSPLASADGRLVGRGVAASTYDTTSYIAMVAEVSIARDLSDLKVIRITTVVDCGIALNPLGIDGQTESAIAWGLSATLHGKIDFREGAAVQSSFADFKVLRMNEMPELETIILDSGNSPSGYGEHPVPLVAPAVANAVFAACGVRARSLPIRLGD